MHAIVTFLVFSTSIFSTALAHKTCTEYSIPVTPTSLNLKYAYEHFKTNYDVIDFISNVTSRTASTDYRPFSSPAVVTASYVISATFCTPKKGWYSSGKVIIATHGLLYDRSYWDPDLQPEKYSFVDYALSQGYSVFFYDRLGVGKSSRVSGYINQLSIQSTILQELATNIKLGKYTASVGKPAKIIFVGHSFGSYTSAAALTANPSLADGLVLTGFSYNGSAGAGFYEVLGPRIASTQSKTWRALDTGYVLPSDFFANINTFFKAPDYDIAAAKWADDHKQPISVSESLSLPTVDTAPTNFTGPALIITGQYDWPFCTGQCDAVLEHPAREIFNKSKAFKAISYPGAGHGLNFAKNAKGSFVEIVNFLKANGL